MRENINLNFFNPKVSYNLQMNYHIYPYKIEEKLSFA